MADLLEKRFGKPQRKMEAPASDGRELDERAKGTHDLALRVIEEPEMDAIRRTYPPELEVAMTLEEAKAALERARIFDVRETEGTTPRAKRALDVRSRKGASPEVSFQIVETMGGERYLVPSAGCENAGIPLMHYLTSRLANPQFLKDDQEKPAPSDLYDHRLILEMRLDEAGTALKDSGLFEVEEINPYRPGSERILRVATIPVGKKPDIELHLVETGMGRVYVHTFVDETPRALLWKSYIEAVIAHANDEKAKA